MHTTLVTKHNKSKSSSDHPNEEARRQRTGKGGSAKSRKRRIIKCSCGLNEETGNRGGIYNVKGGLEDPRETKPEPNRKPSQNPCLVPVRSEQFPPILSDRRELVDRLFVHAHGVISRELVSRHAPVDVTRPVHARNVSDAR